MLMQFLQWIQLLVAIYLVQNLLYLLRVESRASLCLHWDDGRLQPIQQVKSRTLDGNKLRTVCCSEADACLHLKR